MALIEDITPAYKRGYGLRLIPTEVMIDELFKRGVSIEDIFGRFYALEAQAEHRRDEVEGYSEEGQHGQPKQLTVGDALLAAPGIITCGSLEKYDQPF